MEAAAHLEAREKNQVPYEDGEVVCARFAHLGMKCAQVTLAIQLRF